MTFTLSREVTETAPAALYGCTFAVLPPGALHAVLPLADAASWHAVRHAADGRFISGTACPDEASARKEARADRDRLLEAEQDHWRRTGTVPEPMTPALKDAPVITAGQYEEITLTERDSKTRSS